MLIRIATADRWRPPPPPCHARPVDLSARNAHRRRNFSPQSAAHARFAQAAVRPNVVAVTRARPHVLLTGFGPFPGIAENVSSHLAAAVAASARRSLPSFRFEAHVLPTEWQRAPDEARRLYRLLQPAAVLHLGVSARARVFEIETVAHNRTVAAADACGALPAADCVAPDGPVALTAGLPVGAILVRLRRRRIPAVASRDAGGYLCNTLLYHAIDHARRSERGGQAGFVHVPAALRINGRRVSRGLEPRLDWEQAVLGALEIVATMLRQPSPRL